MIGQSFLLMIVGMTTVLVFLVVLIGMINALEWLTTGPRLRELEAIKQAQLKALALKKKKQKSSRPNNDELIAVIGAAVKNYRTNP